MSIYQLPGNLLFGLQAWAEAAAPVAAQLASETYTLSAGRLWSLVAIPLGLASLVLGGVALSRLRSGRRGTEPAAGVALGAGLAGAVIGVLIVMAADGGPGTGYGIVGGYLAVLFGISGTALGALALFRAHRRQTTTA